LRRDFGTNAAAAAEPSLAGGRRDFANALRIVASDFGDFDQDDVDPGRDFAGTMPKSRSVKEVGRPSTDA
jgi:hypothetical protein